MKRKALFAVLSAKVKDGECIFIDRVELSGPKTKEFSKVIRNFPNVLRRSLAFISSGDRTLERAARNIAKLSLLRAQDLNALDLLNNRFVFVPKSAIEVIKKTFLK